MSRSNDEANRRYEQRFDAIEKAASAAMTAHAQTVTETRATIQAHLDDLESQIQEKRSHLTSLLAAHAARDDERYTTVLQLISDQLATITATANHRFDEVRRASDLALANQKEAVEKVEASNERRFEAVNEFRASLSDQASTFMPRGEVQALIAANAQKIDALSTRMDKADGRGDGGAATRNAIYATVATLVAIAGIILAIYTNTRHGA